jgi:uncharacterized membrane protein
MTRRKALYTALSVVLGLIVIGAAIAVGLAMASPPRETFTEFYLLGPGGKAAGYPTSSVAGSELTVTYGIVSHEQEATTYHIEVETGGSVIASDGPVVLAPGEKYESPLAFTPDAAGSHQKVTFLLYREGEASAYRSVYLLVDVVIPNGG